MVNSKQLAAGVVLAATAAVSTVATAGTLQAVGWERNSQVSDLVTDIGGGLFSYEYTVINTSTTCFDEPFNNTNNCITGIENEINFEPVIIDWELPYFDDAAISNIRSPDGWDYAIETIGVINATTGWNGIADWQTTDDPFNTGFDAVFNTVTKVLHWYLVDAQSNCDAFGDPDTCAGIISGSPDSTLTGTSFHKPSLSGFGFDSAYDETAAPYQASWLFLPNRTGDPAFPLAGGVPNSPTLSGIVPDPTVPVPAPLALLALGALGLAFRARR